MSGPEQPGDTRLSRGDPRRSGDDADTRRSSGDAERQRSSVADPRRDTSAAAGSDRHADAPVVGPREAPALHCMTLNVRRPVPHLRRGHQDAWPTRRAAVGRLVASERPHVLAVQEAVPEQVAALAGALGPRWSSEVVGRSARGDGEHVGCFVDRDRLEVLDRRSWALSRHPDRPGSRSWGALFPRVAVLLHLADRVTGVRFAVVATHLDPFSPLALRRGAASVAEVVRETVAAGTPVLAMADWNAGTPSAVARELGSAGLVDTWDTAAARSGPSVGTYVGTGAPRPGRPRLDRVLTADTDRLRAAVDLAAIGTRRPAGVAPSDHLPVHAVLRWTRRDDAGRDSTEHDSTERNAARPDSAGREAVAGGRHDDAVTRDRPTNGTTW